MVQPFFKFKHWVFHLAHLLFEAPSDEDHLLTDFLLHLGVYVLRNPFLLPLLHETHLAVESEIDALLSLHLEDDAFARLELGVIRGEVHKFCPL